MFSSAADGLPFCGPPGMATSLLAMFCCRMEQTSTRGPTSNAPLKDADAQFELYLILCSPVALSLQELHPPNLRRFQQSARRLSSARRIKGRRHREGKVREALAHPLHVTPTHPLRCRQGNTALYWAIDRNHAEVTSYLRRIGAPE